MTSKIVCGAVVVQIAAAHPVAMPRTARAHPKTPRKKTFIKAWRKHKNDMTLAKLSERLFVEEAYEVSEGQLSRIERGLQPYTQDLLEAIARIMSCDAPDLLRWDPTDKNSPYSILESVKPTEREQRQAVAFIETLRRTGTDN